MLTQPLEERLNRVDAQLQQKADVECVSSLERSVDAKVSTVAQWHNGARTQWRNGAVAQ